LTAQAGAGGSNSAFVSDSQSVVLVDTGAFKNSASTVTGTYFLNDTGSITETGTAVAANTVALVASVNIGTSTASPLAVNAANLTAQAGNAGANSVFITDSQSVALVNTGAFVNAASNVTGTYYLNDTGSITSGGGTAVAANTVVLVASANIGV